MKTNPLQNIADAITMANHLQENGAPMGGTMSEENYKKLSPLLGEFLAPETETNKMNTPTIVASIVDEMIRVEILTNEFISPALQGQLNLLVGRFCKYALKGKPVPPEELFLASIILGGGGAECLLEAIKSAAEATKQPA